MNPRQILAAWLAGPLVVLAALLCAAWLRPQGERRFEGAQIGVVGSSLSAYAFPERTTLADGRRIKRVGIAAPSESELVTLLNAAIEERSQLVLLEATSLVADFAFEREPGCKAPVDTLRKQIRSGQIALVDELRRLFGQRTSLEGFAEPERLNAPQRVDRAQIANFYPLTIHPPCESEALAAAAARAKAAGVRIVLLELPRSPIGESALGPRQAGDLAAQMTMLAVKLDLPPLHSGGPWVDAEFADQAHLNGAGRARFLRQLEKRLEPAS